MAPYRIERTSDAYWPELLSFAGHEIRSPLTVIAGYVRMLLNERAGPLAEEQRRLLKATEKSCAQMSHVLREVSDLSRLEAGTAEFTRRTVDLRGVLADAIAALPPANDSAATVALEPAGASTVHGDPARLKSAFVSILFGLRRELVTSTDMRVRMDSSSLDGKPAIRIVIGEAGRIPLLLGLPSEQLGAFNEGRGGNGLSLATARCVITAHGGTVVEPRRDEGRAAAIISIPSI